MQISRTELGRWVVTFVCCVFTLWALGLVIGEITK